MSDLTFPEKNQLEKLFQMSEGYVLSFNNRTFKEFVADTVGKEIDSDKYQLDSGSKANRLRAFWKVEPNCVVGRLIAALIDYSEMENYNSPDPALVAECRKIAARLLEGAPVIDSEALKPNAIGRTFESLSKSVRESIDSNQPAQGLDRLHTFVVKYIRTVCEHHEISTEKDKPLHSCFGEYVKYLQEGGFLDSEMTVRILKSSISILESFNRVRNNNSFAHDNELLEYDESLLIFNNIASLIRFIEAVEGRIVQQNGIEDDSDIPF